MTAPFAWQPLWHHGGPRVRHETKVIYRLTGLLRRASVLWQRWARRL